MKCIVQAGESGDFNIAEQRPRRSEAPYTRYTSVIAVFLGAGFSAPAGVPLASHLFDAAPEVDKITRQRLVDRVLARLECWRL